MPVPGEKSERYKRRQAMMDKIRSLTATKRVRVMPATEEKRALRHPGTSARFRKEGSVEWPFDTFTKRRLADGDIKLDESRTKDNDKTDESRAKSADTHKQHARPTHEQHPAGS